MSYLKAIWVLAHYRSSLHLKAFIENNQQWLLEGIKAQDFEGFPKEERRDLAPLLAISTHIRKQLKNISSSTIERLLKPIKDEYKLKKRYRVHPHASVLKRKIPVEPHYNKPTGKVGYMESDTVYFSGGRSEKGFCLGYVEAEQETDWTESRALRNRAHSWTERAMWVIGVMIRMMKMIKSINSNPIILKNLILIWVRFYFDLRRPRLDIIRTMTIIIK